MKQLQLQDSGGAALTSWDFGEIAPGQLSASKVISLRNTGDEPVTGLKAWIEQSTADGALSVTIGGTAITGTSAGTATVLGNLAVGAALAGTAQHTAPTIPLDSAVLRITAD